MSNNSFAGQTCTTTQIGGSNDDFKGISGSSDSNVLAVGKKGIAYLYNGSSWSSLSTGTNEDLNAVFVLDSNFSVAVGDEGTIRFNNSGTWSASTSGTSEQFNAVWAFSSSNIYAVGKDGELRYYNGSNWSDQSSTAGTGSKDLEAVWGNSSFFYALAKDGTLFKYNRSTSSWTSISSCASALSEDAKGIWGDNSGNIYIAVKGGSVYQYDGSSCTQVMTAAEDLEAIFGSDTTGEIYAVGKKGLVAYYSSNWTSSSEGSEDIKAVWVSSAGNAYYASKKGYTSTCTYTATPAGSSCTTTTIAGGEDLEGISGNSTSNVIGVGKEGVVWQYDGSSWSQVTVPGNPDEDLKDVYVIDASNSVVVGKKGTVMLQNNGTWSVLSAPSNEELKGVWAYSNSDIWVFGKKGSIYHWDGSAWTDHKAAASAGNSDDFEDAWGNSQYVYGLTKKTNLFRYDRSALSWSSIPTCNLSNIEFKDLWGDSSGNVYLAGKDKNNNDIGVVYQYNGSTCVQVASATKELSGIYGSDSTGEIYAVGKDGYITKYDGSIWTASRSGTKEIKDVWVASDGTAFYAGKDGLVTTCSVASSSLHHILLLHDGTAINCNPESITVKACSNLSCSTVSSTDVSVTLNPTGWVSSDTQTITSGSSSFQLRQSSAATYRLGVSASTPSASSTVECTNSATATTNTTTACDIIYYASGFIYDISDGQTACSSSSSVTVSAVRTDVTSQQCVPSFASRTESLNFWTSYTSPASGSKQLTVNNGSTNYTIATSSPGTAVPLTFNSSGQATMTVTYPDAGKITLSSSFSGTGSESGLTMTGSDAFTTIPAKFYVYSSDSNNACSSNDATCSAFKKAGSSFNLNVRAACSDNSVTPNFVLSNIIMTLDNTAPNVNEGSLAVTTFSMVSGDSGEHTISTEAVTEVGVFTFTATAATITDSSNIYYGLSLNAGTSTYIGRFYPDHFTLNSSVLTNRSDILSCSDGFTYLDENFKYLYNLRAENSSAALTLNYTGSFAKLSVSSLAQMNYGTTNSSSSYSARTSVSSSGSFSNGIAAVTAIVSLARVSSSELPLTAFTTGITPQDSDSVLLGSYNLSLTGGSNTHGSLGATVLRQGRSVISNAFGSEYSALSVPWNTEYYVSAQAGFVINTSDSCSPLNTSLLTLSNGGGTLSQGVATIPIGSGSSTASVSNNPVAAGIAGLSFSAPSYSGYADVSINFSTLDYLQFDWDSDGSHDDNPATVRATFGSYRGDDRIIYWQELFE